MQPQEIYNKVERRFSGKVSGFRGDVFDPSFIVAADSIVDVCRYLRDDPETAFEALSDETAVDWPKENKLQVVYHLYSYSKRQPIVLKVDLPREGGKVATVEGVWTAANWFEREIFDLFGIDFVGHSDLRRIMLPEDWVGHPLLKDYVEQEEYDGISTQRAPLVDKLLK